MGPSRRHVANPLDTLCFPGFQGPAHAAGVACGLVQWGHPVELDVVHAVLQKCRAVAVLVVVVVVAVADFFSNICFFASCCCCFLHDLTQVSRRQQVKKPCLSRNHIYPATALGQGGVNSPAAASEAHLGRVAAE